VSSIFGEQRSYNGGPATGSHSGTDFVGETGDGIFASAAGRVGTAGGGGGYEFGDHNSIPNVRRTSIAVEFDDWDGGHGDNDPPDGGSNGSSDNNWHVGVNFNEGNQSAQNNVEYGAALPRLFNSSPGVHAEVIYTPRGDVSRTEVWLSDNAAADPAATRTKVLSVIGPRLRGECYVGFTGATGGASANHEIDNFVLSKISCGAPPGGIQKPMDYNQDGQADISDAVQFLGNLFLGDPVATPCGGTANEGGNKPLLNFDGQGDADITDGINLLLWSFLGGPPHFLGSGCVRIVGCPDNSALCVPQ
jgi:hypothetical protein